MYIKIVLVITTIYKNWHSSSCSNE